MVVQLVDLCLLQRMDPLLVVSLRPTDFNRPVLLSYCCRADVSLKLLLSQRLQQPSHCTPKLAERPPLCACMGCCCGQWQRAEEQTMVLWVRQWGNFVSVGIVATKAVSLSQPYHYHSIIFRSSAGQQQRHFQPRLLHGLQ
jgi:hypothetical protein